MKKKLAPKNPWTSPPPEPPFHHFDMGEYTICKTCGWVAGSGGGKMPPCQISTLEEIQNRMNEGLKILAKIIGKNS